MKGFKGPRITLIELLVILSILLIFVSIICGAIQHQRESRTPYSPGSMSSRCEFCKGTGVRQSINAQGQSENMRCPSCGGSGTIR